MDDEIRTYLESTIKDVGIVGAIISGLVFVWKRGIKPMFIQYQHTQDLINKINLIVSELTPNGGGSIKDAITRIETRQVIAESRTKALLIDSDLGLWESDESGQCIWWNRTLESMHGREPTGMNWIAAVVSGEREEVLREWEQSVRLKREFYMTITYQRQDGMKTPCIVKAYPLLDARRQVRGWVGVATRIKDGH